jgi:hypothetical protein
MRWPYQKEKALAAFMGSFDLATQDFKAIGDDPKQLRSSYWRAFPISVTK